MKRSFTLKEMMLVMVFLILLVSVAVNKLGSMSQRAEEASLKAFVETLNHTGVVGFWERSLQEGNGGSVAITEYDLILDQYIELVPGYSEGPLLINCNEKGDGVFMRYPLSTNYEIHCRDGNKERSPDFRLYSLDTVEYLD